jgi:hypothetical protein
MVYQVVFESTSIVTVLRRQVRIRRRTCEARMLIVHIAFGLQQRYIVECNNVIGIVSAASMDMCCFFCMESPSFFFGCLP